MGEIQICKTLRLAESDVPIIMLIALGTTDDKVEGIGLATITSEQRAKRFGFGKYWRIRGQHVRLLSKDFLIDY